MLNIPDNKDNETRLTIAQLLKSGELHEDHKFHVVYSNDTAQSIVGMTVWLEDAELLNKNL